MTLINKTKFLNDADFIIRLAAVQTLVLVIAITVPYHTLYTLRVFYIIAMISDSYYLIAIQLLYGIRFCVS